MLELREVQRALDHAALQLAARQGCVAVAADVAQCIKVALDIGEHDPLALDRGEFHLARREVAHPRDGDEAFRHAINVLVSLGSEIASSLRGSSQ